MKGIRALIYALYAWAAFPARPAWSGPLEDLQPGHWIELPCQNTIRAVLPDPVPAGNGPISLIEAWNSGAYDTRRDRLIIWGGGHMDYRGNEIYAFSLATLAWQRLTDPGAEPVAVHTYDALEYLPLQDRFFTQGGSTWPTGYGTRAAWSFDFEAGKWARRADMPIGGALGNVTAYDPASGKIVWDGTGDSDHRLYEYDPGSDRWTPRGSGPAGNYHQTAALDPKLRKFVRVGGGEILAYDLAAAGTLTPRIPATTGPGDMVSVNYPGIDYDPVGGVLVAWHGGGSVYSLDLSTLAWARHDAAGKHPGPAVANGTFNRWRYVPSKNVFLVVNSIDGKVFAYKHREGPSAPKWYLDLLQGDGLALVPGNGRRILTPRTRFVCLAGSLGLGIPGLSVTESRIHRPNGVLMGGTR